MNDIIDERILCELRNNAKLPVTTLAKIVGRSRTAVQERINRLEASGGIKSYTIIESGQSNESDVMAIVFVSVSIRNKSNNLIGKLKSMPNVISCLAITGDAALAVMIRRTTSEDLNWTIERIYEFEGVTKTETVISLHTIF